MPAHPSYPQLTVRLEPEGEELTLSANTALQLLNRLGKKPTTCLVIREPDPADATAKRVLLTPDRKLKPGETLTVRSVVSTG